MITTRPTSTPPAETATEAPTAPPLTPPPAAPGRPAPQQAAPASSPSGHRLPRTLLRLVVLLAVVAVGWWLSTARPWVSPPGPLVASGTLEADEVLVGAEVSGRILGLSREGDAVQAGQVVARLDDSLIQLQLRQVDTATQQQLAIQAEKYQPRTPISGIVTRVPLHAGEVVSPGQAVVAVADLTALDLTAYVLERDLGQVRVGQEVGVTADPFPGRTFYGVVTSTSQRAEFTPRNVQTQRDRLNLVFGVKIRVQNPDGALKPGMPADATFTPL